MEFCQICGEPVDIPRIDPLLVICDKCNLDALTANEDINLDSGYGFFPGGDPRTFTPDYDLCTPEEIANWQADCDAWNRGEPTVYPPNHIPLVNDKGENVGHFTQTRYGIGGYTISE